VLWSVEAARQEGGVEAEDLLGGERRGCGFRWPDILPEELGVLIQPVVLVHLPCLPAALGKPDDAFVHLVGSRRVNDANHRYLGLLL